MKATSSTRYGPPDVLRASFRASDFMEETREVVLKEKRGALKSNSSQTKTFKYKELSPSTRKGRASRSSVPSGSLIR
jgi:hypothetical protein